MAKVIIFTQATLMPDNRAAVGLPPTAYTFIPNGVCLRTTCMTMNTANAMMLSTGSPRNRDVPKSVYDTGKL